MKRGYFNPSYISNLFADLRGDRANLSQQIWTIYNLVAWYDYWIERPQQAVAA
jgi:asparagine synthase (glutamine-hydrolysing)